MVLCRLVTCMRGTKRLPLTLLSLPSPVLIPSFSIPFPSIHVSSTGSRHRQVSNLFDQRPRVASNAFVAPSATVVGEVELWDKVSIWYGAVIRGDRNSVKIGNCTNVQDHAVITTVSSLDTGFPAKVDIGHMVTIGTSMWRCGASPSLSKEHESTQTLPTCIVLILWSLSSAQY